MCECGKQCAFIAPGSIFPQRPPAKTLQNISSGSKLACSCGQTSQYAQLSRWAWKTFSYLRNWVGGKKIIFSMRTQTAWSPDGDIYEAAWNGPACQKCGRKNALVAQTGSICNWPEHLLCYETVIYWYWYSSIRTNASVRTYIVHIHKGLRRCPIRPIFLRIKIVSRWIEGSWKLEH